MLYTHFTKELLGLQGVKITNVEKEENNIIIYLEMERKSHSSRSDDPSCRLTLFQENLFVLDTPIFCWEVIKRLTAYQLHGSFTLAWFSRNRPHCLRRLHAGLAITLGLWLDGSIIIPIACHCRIGSYPMVIDYCFSLPA